MGLSVGGGGPSRGTFGPSWASDRLAAACAAHSAGSCQLAFLCFGICPAANTHTLSLTMTGLEESGHMISRRRRPIESVVSHQADLETAAGLSVPTEKHMGGQSKGKSTIGGGILKMPFHTELR